MNIYQRMLKVMEAVSYVQKEDKKVNNQYTFVSHDAVAAKIRPELIKQGVVMTVDVREMKQDGNRTEAAVQVKFVNAEKPDDFVAVTSYGYGIDPQDKGPGKAVSYAVKYALLKSFCLETGDDPEKDSIPHKPAEAVKITPAAGAVDRLDAGRKESLDRLCADCTTLLADGEVEQALDYMAEITDPDEKVYLWSLFGSKDRSAMKKVIDARKQERKAA